VNAILIGLVLLCLTPVAQHLPLNALAAIVIMGVIGLLDFGHFFCLLRVSYLKEHSSCWHPRGQSLFFAFFFLNLSVAIILFPTPSTLQVNRADCLVWLVTWLGCLTVAIDVDLGFGVSLGLLFLFVKTAFSVLIPRSCVSGSQAYRGMRLYDLEVRLSDLFCFLSILPPYALARLFKLKL